MLEQKLNKRYKAWFSSWQIYAALMSLSIIGFIENGIAGALHQIKLMLIVSLVFPPL